MRAILGLAMALSISCPALAQDISDNHPFDAAQIAGASDEDLVGMLWHECVFRINPYARRDSLYMTTRITNEGHNLLISNLWITRWSGPFTDYRDFQVSIDLAEAEIGDTATAGNEQYRSVTLRGTVAGLAQRTQFQGEVTSYETHQHGESVELVCREPADAITVLTELQTRWRAS